MDQREDGERVVAVDDTLLLALEVPRTHGVVEGCGVDELPALVDEERSDAVAIAVETERILPAESTIVRAASPAATMLPSSAIARIEMG